MIDGVVKAPVVKPPRVTEAVLEMLITGFPATPLPLVILIPLVPAVRVLSMTEPVPKRT